MSRWPDIPFEAWAQTCAALHLFTQIAGKYRIAHTPWVNHSWHATLYVNGRGLTTGLIPDGPGVEIEFDLIDHQLIAKTSYGKIGYFALEPMAVAEFHDRFKNLVADIGGDANFHGTPNEVADPMPFTNDHKRRPYDAEAVTRFFHALSLIDRVFKKFRAGFLGKVSPVHLFWGSFDLAVTRFSGRAAPRHPGGIPALPDDITREAYSHEVSSAGFWPGGGPSDDAAFYSYAYPNPDDFEGADIAPVSAYWHGEAGEFILPYKAVIASGHPEETLLTFLQATYDAAASRAHWDRIALDCPIGAPGKPRVLVE